MTARDWYLYGLKLGNTVKQLRLSVERMSKVASSELKRGFDEAQK